MGYAVPVATCLTSGPPKFKDPFSKEMKSPKILNLLSVILFSKFVF